jgi:hypothetical protein
MKLNSLILGLLFFATAISLLLCWLPIFSAETNDFISKVVLHFDGIIVNGRSNNV